MTKEQLEAKLALMIVKGASPAQVREIAEQAGFKLVWQVLPATDEQPAGLWLGDEKIDFNR